MQGHWRETCPWKGGLVSEQGQGDPSINTGPVMLDGCENEDDRETSTTYLSRT